MIGVSGGSPTTLSVTITDNDPAGQIFVDGFESADSSAWE
jgi:hypothetical protein